MLDFKQTGRPKGSKNKKPASSDTTYKRENKELLRFGQRKCKQCGETYPVDKFEVLREVPTPETKDLKPRYIEYVPVYGTVCIRCRQYEAKKKQITKDLQ